MEPSEVFNQHRPLLFSIAYRMLGRVMGAEDIVQGTMMAIVLVIDVLVFLPHWLLVRRRRAVSTFS